MKALATRRGYESVMSDLYPPKNESALARGNKSRPTTDSIEAYMDKHLFRIPRITEAEYMELKRQAKQRRQRTKRQNGAEQPRKA
jgi:hypothetical protein